MGRSPRTTLVLSQYRAGTCTLLHYCLIPAIHKTIMTSGYASKCTCVAWSALTRHDSSNASDPCMFYVQVATYANPAFPNIRNAITQLVPHFYVAMLLK